MMMSRMFVSAAFLSVSAFAFGGAKTEEVGQDACHSCVCENNAGTLEDPSDKKCCSTDTWDSTCDGISLFACAADCATHPSAHGAHGGFRQAFAKEAHLGEFCGELFSNDIDCDNSFVCHTDNGKYGYCETYAEHLHHATEANTHTHGAYIDLGLSFSNVREESVMLDGVRQTVVYVDVQHPEGFDMSQLSSTLSESMGIDTFQISEVKDTPNRRQYGYNPWTGRTQVQISGGSSTPSASTSYSSSQSVESVANSLKQQGVELLAFDWDLTANTKHTYQGSYSSYQQIAAYMSKDFIELSTHWCELDKPVAVVTYNDATLYVGGRPVNGEYMIRQILDNYMPNKKCGQDIYLYADNLSGTGQGKNPHLQGAQQHYGVYQNAATMLIDDTKKNIDAARPKGYKTTWVNPASGFKYSNMN